ncbi:MAG: hypothetical protein ACI4TF_14425, partial [Oliverpabstia sp.]
GVRFSHPLLETAVERRFFYVTENGKKKESICAFRNHVFRTKTGIELLNTMFGITILSQK